MPADRRKSDHVDNLTERTERMIFEAGRYQAENEEYIRALAEVRELEPREGQQRLASQEARVAGNNSTMPTPPLDSEVRPFMAQFEAALTFSLMAKSAEVPKNVTFKFDASSTDLSFEDHCTLDAVVASGSKRPAGDDGGRRSVKKQRGTSHEETTELKAIKNSLDAIDRRLDKIEQGFAAFREGLNTRLDEILAAINAGAVEGGDET